MTRRYWPQGQLPTHRDLKLAPVLRVLRELLGVPVHAAAPGEAAAHRGRGLPTVVEAVDSGAWIAWSLVGIQLFSGDGLPSIHTTTDEARRVLLALAMERTGGNITHIAAALGTSRRAVRGGLKAMGLYDLAARLDEGEQTAEAGELRLVDVESLSNEAGETIDDEEETRPIRAEDE